MNKVTGVVESKSRKGNSIKVDGEWYGTFSAADLNNVEWKDSVEFMWDYDKTGKYKNIKGKVTKTDGATSSPPSGRGKANNYSLGVELGHASNLAMRMMEQLDYEYEVGSADWYKAFIEFTNKNYKVMSALRAQHEAGNFNTPEPVSAGHTSLPDAVVEQAPEGDIF